MWSWVHLTCIGVVAQPLRLAETLFYSGSCVVPLRLGGLRGKKSTPSVGWEVPVSILGSASKNWYGVGRGTDRGHSNEVWTSIKAGKRGQGMVTYPIKSKALELL